MIFNHLSRKVELAATCCLIIITGRVQYELWTFHGRIGAEYEVVCEDVMRCSARLQLI